MTTPGWEGILDKDEDIVWQGRPDGKLVWRIGNIVTLMFGIFFAGFALFWMVLASTAGGYFWMFGLIHFFVGVGVGFGAIFWSAYSRRNSWYTLTNKRAFIATEIPFQGRRIKSYPIEDNTMLEFDGNEPASIYFATEVRRGQNSSRTVKIGFERIENGRDVYAKFREVQENAA